MLTASESKVREWREKPQLFVREVFHVTPDPWQDKLLEAFPRPDLNRFAGIACKGPGKTAVEAWLGWNFLLTRPHPKVVATSITGDNLRDGLWTEFAKWQRVSPLLQAAFQWTSGRIFNKSSPNTWWASARTWPKDGDPEQQANTLAGLHEDFLLFLIDEASDIPRGVVTAAEAALTGGKETKLIVMGNCTQTDGPIWHAAQRPELWFTVRISGDPDDPERSPRINIDEARRQIAEHGIDSYVVRVNILGKFPDRADDKLLDARDCQLAQGRDAKQDSFGHLPLVIGCDPARYGSDSTVIIRRQGRMCWTPRVLKQLDTVQTAEQLMGELDSVDADAAFVDEVGIGAGVIDTCRSRGYGKRIFGVNAGSKAREETRFVNRRAEMYWHTADWVRSGGCLPKDDLLAGELAAPHYDYDPKQRVRLEPKDDVKARLGRSPDRADALSLTFASPVRRQERQRAAGPNAGSGSLNDYNPLGGA